MSGIAKFRGQGNLARRRLMFVTESARTNDHLNRPADPLARAELGNTWEEDLAEELLERLERQEQTGGRDR